MPTSPSQVTIPNTEMRVLSSSVINQEFSIFVALPQMYAVNNNTYPIVYALDANANFGILTETVRLLTVFNEIPEVIIVGIGYPVKTIKEAQGFRTRDLTPSETDWYETRLMSFLPEAPVYAGSGGAANFLRFIREELIPFVNSNYRVNSEDSAFMGFSFGGLFGLYSLFNHPDTFKRYFLGSPSIWWNDGTIFNLENEFATQNGDLSAKVFLSVAGKDGDNMISNTYKMADVLRGRNYKSLEITTHFFEGETHMSNFPAFVSWGLRVGYL